MRSFETFIKLLQNEANLKYSLHKEPTYSIQDIKAGFLEIISCSEIALESISFAHIAGSYSRGEQTPYSDIDLECFSPSMMEYQDTYTWNGLLVSLAVYPINSVRGEGTNIIDRSWARSCFKSSQVVYDPNDVYEEYRRQFIEDEKVNYPTSNETPFAKNLRKIIEYRRKMLSAISGNDQLFYNFATSRFIESFVIAKNIFLKSEVSSERGQFDILSERTLCLENNLHHNALNLFKPNITEQECINLTVPFFEDLIHVTKHFNRK